MTCTGMLAGLALLLAGTSAFAQSVVTYDGNPARSGHYVVPGLTDTKAAGVHLDAGFHATVDGAVYGQPLYWAPSNAIIVATEKNQVYALNANTGAQIWRTQLGTPVPLSALPCGDINPMGVTGTPVIDPSTGTVYLEAYIQTAGGPRHQVFGLTLTNGNLAPGWPVDVMNGVVRASIISPKGNAAHFPSSMVTCMCPMPGIMVTVALTVGWWSGSISPLREYSVFGPLPWRAEAVGAKVGLPLTARICS